MIQDYIRASLLLSLFIASAMVWAQEAPFRQVESSQVTQLSDPFLSADVVKRSRYFIPATHDLREYLAQSMSRANGTKIQPLTIELFGDLHVAVSATEVRKGQSVWVAYFEGEYKGKLPAQGNFVSGVLTLFPDDRIVGNFASTDFYIGINFSNQVPYHFAWEAVDGYTIPVD